MAIINKSKINSNIMVENETVSVEYESNIASVNNVSTEVLISKSVSKGWGLPEAVIDVTTTITNNMDTNISDVKILDSLSDGATFVTGSVYVGGQEYPEYDPIVGFDLPVTIGAGADMTMTYKIKIDQLVEAQTVTDATQATITAGGSQFVLTSDPVLVSVVHNEISLLKEASKTVVQAGDELTYTITITNSGTFTNTDVQFSDPIPDGTTFVEGSVSVDDVIFPKHNPATGFALQDIGAGESIVVKFRVMVE